MLSDLCTWHRFLNETYGGALQRQPVHLQLRFAACALRGQAIRLEEQALGQILRNDWLPWPMEDMQALFADNLNVALNALTTVSTADTAIKPCVPDAFAETVHLPTLFATQADVIDQALARGSRPNYKAAANDADVLSDYFDSLQSNEVQHGLEVLTLAIVRNGALQGYDSQQALAWRCAQERTHRSRDKIKAPYHLLRASR